MGNVDKKEQKMTDKYVNVKGVSMKESIFDKIGNKVWSAKHFVADNKAKFIAGGTLLGAAALGLAASKAKSGNSPEDDGDYTEVDDVVEEETE